MQDVHTSWTVWVWHGYWPRSSSARWIFEEEELERSFQERGITTGLTLQWFRGG